MIIDQLQRLPEKEVALSDCCGGTFMVVVTAVPLTCPYITIGMSTCHSCTNTN